MNTRIAILDLGTNTFHLLTAEKNRQCLDDYSPRPPGS
ncbi:MAG: hypothetical protein KatS3mg032_1575 [Cyclobacteriaceae bacterium]|nr:MAG: hypothetical protein KatS3mg032_1575 [Cyclobacteriaceae bacterium]